MIIELRRFSYSETETEGILIIGSMVLATIEQPWTPNPNGAPGGKPFESCIPDGTYRLVPWTRPNGDPVYMIINEDLGVFAYPDDHPAGHGRDLCLAHSANWVTQIEGCCAPGLARLPMKNPETRRMEQAVTSSRVAMSRIRSALGNVEHVLIISSDTGASDGN